MNVNKTPSDTATRDSISEEWKVLFFEAILSPHILKSLHKFGVIEFQRICLPILARNHLASFGKSRDSHYNRKGSINHKQRLLSGSPFRRRTKHVNRTFHRFQRENRNVHDHVSYYREALTIVPTHVWSKVFLHCKASNACCVPTCIEVRIGKQINMCDYPWKATWSISMNGRPKFPCFNIYGNPHIQYPSSGNNIKCIHEENYLDNVHINSSLGNDCSLRNFGSHSTCSIMSCR